MIVVRRPGAGARKYHNYGDNDPAIIYDPVFVCFPISGHSIPAFMMTTPVLVTLLLADSAVCLTTLYQRTSNISTGEWGQGSLSMSAANLDSSAIIILSSLTCVQNKIYGLAKITYNFVSEVVELKSSFIRVYLIYFLDILKTFCYFLCLHYFVG